MERCSGVGTLRFSPDGSQLVGAHRNGRISIWNVPAGTLVQEMAGHTGQNGVATGAGFLSDGQRIISVGLDDTVRIWEIESGRESWRGEFGLLGINALALSRDGRLAAWAGNDRRILVWDLETGCRRFQIVTTASAIFHLSFSPDGTTLAFAGSEEKVRLYSTQTALELSSITLGMLPD